MLKNLEGHNVPNVTFKVIDGVHWKEISTNDLFENKKVIVFSLPGAFTPTCSSSHVPRYNDLLPLFKDLGIDDIICVSVNDTFVMNSWKQDQNAPEITFIPDGNGDFSQEMGMLVDKKSLGFGYRSWRYSMLVDNKVIKKMFIEPEVEGDPFEVSDADTMLNYLAPNNKTPKNCAIFTKVGCPFCVKAKKLLKENNIAFDEIVVGTDVKNSILQSVTGRTTVPQVYIESKHIGGSDDLEAFLNK